MSNWKLVEFGRNPVHFGEVGIGLEETSERVRSDTLFSAWINAYARCFGKVKVESLLDRFLQNDSPPVRMSSTFVFRKANDQLIYYLPKPLGRPRKYPKENDLEFFKTYKKLRYLPLEIWQRWYQGKGFIDADAEELKEQAQNKTASGLLQNAGTFNYSDAFQRDRLPKVAIDRTTRSTNFYHTGFVQFAWEAKESSNSGDTKQQESQDNSVESQAGLYFLLNFSQKDSLLEDELHSALILLGDEGLGGERSSGAGRFKIAAWEELSQAWQDVVSFDKGTHYSLMSVFWKKSLPADFIKESSYDFLERGGWIGSTFSGKQQRRKKVRMFAEGSIFKMQPMGMLANVTPHRFNRHQIYRNGLSLSLPIAIDPLQKNS